MARAITILDALDAGNDLLTIQANVEGVVDADGNPKVVEATGWVSALTNYYPPYCYGEGGNLLPGSVPRAMTTPEKLTYCKARIAETRPDLVDPPQSLNISG